MKSFCTAFFSIKNIEVFEILTFEILINDVVSFEQLGPEFVSDGYKFTSPIHLYQPQLTKSVGAP